jgi:hypothetical protein
LSLGRRNTFGRHSVGDLRATHLLFSRLTYITRFIGARLATIISTFPMQNSTVWTVFFLIYSTHLQVSHRFRPIQLLPAGYTVGPLVCRTLYCGFTIILIQHIPNVSCIYRSNTI